MKKEKRKIQNLRGVLLTLTVASVLQSCLPSPDKPAASTTSQTAAQCDVSGEQLSQSSNDDIFKDVTATVTQNQDTTSDNRKRRYVQIDTATLKNRILKRTTNHLKLPLFTDKLVDVNIQDIKQYSQDNIVITGKTDDDISAVTVVLKNDVVMANISEQGKKEHYQIKFSGNGVHTIQEVTAADDGECATAESEMVTQPNSVEATAQDTTLSPLANPVIDVLVAYTTAAKNDAGGATAIQALIQMGIADSNAAYVHSGVALSLRLVGTMEVTQAESDFSSDLAALAGTTDGKWDEVHAERKRLGADLVDLVAHYTGTTTVGIGYIGSTYSTGFSISDERAFSQYTFTHELGHNIGLQHSDGYNSDSGQFRTVMAYGSYTRIPYFSNPNVIYNGNATGTAANNSAAVLNANNNKVAGFAVSTATVSEPATPSITPPANTCTNTQ